MTPRRRSLVEANMPEVVARVAVAWLRRYYRQNRSYYILPGSFMNEARAEIPPRMAMLLFALSALADTIHRYGLSSNEWLNRACLCSDWGLDHRTCWWPGYKANRHA